MAPLSQVRPSTAAHRGPVSKWTSEYATGTPKAEVSIRADIQAPEQPSTSASRNRDTPYSPRPRLFDNLPLPEGPVASDVLSEADYRRLRSNAFRPSVIAGPLLVSSFLGETAQLKPAGQAKLQARADETQPTLPLEYYHPEAATPTPSDPASFSSHSPPC